MNERERIGVKIAELRQWMGMTQEELSEATGLDKINISKIERGKYNVSIDLLAQLSTALGCKMDIFTDSDYDNLEIVKRTKMAEGDFHYYKASTEQIKLFGDWAVNKDGDVLNYTKGYPLYSYYLEDQFNNKETWIEHIGRKLNFDIEHFALAFDYALPLSKAGN